MKKQLTTEEFVDWWLKKYFDTDSKTIIKEHPEYLEDNRGFFKRYAVTQQQHDEWYDWAIDRISKYYRMGKKAAKRNFVWDYLNTSPSIKGEIKLVYET